jgi:uncharacterized small protein (DUF1192 family)
MATFQVLIGGVDRTSVIAVETFTAEIGSRENITTCSFDIRDESRAIEVKGAESVVVRQDATTIWSGYVGNVSVSFDGNANMLAVDAQSGNNMLDQKAYRTIGYVSKGVALSGNDKGSIRPYGFSRTFGAEVVWLLANSTCSPGASPITYSSAKIYKATNSLTARVDYGGKTLREGLEDFIKAAYGAKKMTFWVDATGALNIQPTGQSANMLENFDFYGNSSSNWTLAGGASLTTAAGQSTGAVGAGSVADYGVQLDNSGESALQNAAVVAGRRYYAAGALKNQTANRGRINLIWKTSGGATISTDSLSTATTGSWVRLEGIYTAPATAASVDYKLAYSGTTSGAAYFDNLQIIEENAGFGISDTPNNTSTFAPEDYEESIDSSAVINAVAIKGKKYTVGKTYASDGNDAWQTYYVEYSPSIAYFGKVFTTALDDDKVSSDAKALEAAYKIFSESAFPIREGTYKISSAKLGAIVPTPGTYQIFQMSRMPSARQVTINRIESVSVLPYGAGEVVYEVQFGAQKGNIASALATVGSAMWGTGKPKTGSTVFEHNFVRDGLFSTGRTLTNPQVTGVAAEVEQGAAISSIAAMSVVKKNTALTPANNLPNLADYGGDGEFPLGSLILLVPDAGDPHLTKPTLYRSDGATTWTAVTPAQLKSDAVDAGRMGNGMIVADSIFAGTIDAGTIDVTNLNASNINAGALSLAPLSANAITSTNFTVTNTGAVTAKDLTLIPSTSEVQGIDAAAGAITLEPPTAFGAVTLKVTNSDGTGDYDSVGFTSSAGAAANAAATVVTDTVHNFKVGQMVSFHSVGTTWNDITATAPIQIITTPTTTSFTVEHFAALPAIASNSAGTIRAYKRLAIRAAGGFYVYRDATNAGDIAAGSLVLGNNLANYGKDNLATVADGELAFLKSATPRYGSGANLYSSNGTTNVSTSGNFSAAGGVNTTLVASTSDLSAQIDGGDLIVRHGTGAGVNPRILFRNGAGTYIAGLRATIGTLTLYADSGTSNLGNFTAAAINGSSVTASGNVISNGTGFLNDTPTTQTTPTTYTSGRAAIWTNTAGTAYRLDRYVAASSARAKKNIELTDVAPEQFYGINLVDFEYDSEAAKAIWSNLSEMPTETQHGVIYEQVKEVMPEAVFDEDTSGAGDPPGINWDQIYFAALVALQEMNERVKVLEAEIAELKNGSGNIKE